MSTLFLVQIPNTACTSVRLAACRHWGSHSIVSDYGRDHVNTSAAVRECVHIDKDLPRMKRWLQEQRIELFACALPLRRLRRIFPADHIVTLLRDPVERTVAAYHSAVGIHGYSHGLERFCRTVEQRNVQSRYLREMPLELLGFVGLTERYTESLELLNARFGCTLTELNPTVSNARDTHPIDQVHSQIIEDDIRAMILEHNVEDEALYQTAVQLFDTRLQLHLAKQVFTHGLVQQLTEDRVQGWAFRPSGEEPCKVRVVINDACVSVRAATDYVSQLKERNVCRDGYVGFSYRFDHRLAVDDVVSCYVHQTEQLLTGPQRVSR